MYILFYLLHQLHLSLSSDLSIDSSLSVSLSVLLPRCLSLPASYLFLYLPLTLTLHKHRKYDDRRLTRKLDKASLIDPWLTGRTNAAPTVASWQSATPPPTATTNSSNKCSWKPFDTVWPSVTNQLCQMEHDSLSGLTWPKKIKKQK